MQPLRERIGDLPYLYVVHSPLNDYQVTIECPIGRAVLTEIDGGENYEIETAFDGQSVRSYHGFETTEAALKWLVVSVEHTMFNRGVMPPPRVDPRRRRYVVLAAIILGVLATLALLATFSGSDNDGSTPTTSFTTAPGGAR